MDKLVNDPFSFAALRAIELGHWDAYLFQLSIAIRHRQIEIDKAQIEARKNGVDTRPARKRLPAYHAK